MLIQTAIAFLLKSAVCSGLMLGYYWLALRNKKLHQYNRFYLLSTVAISLIVPFLHFEWYHVVVPQNAQVIRLLPAVDGGIAEPEVVAGGASWWLVYKDMVLLMAYAAVAATLLLLLVAKIAWVYKLKRKSAVIEMHGFDIVHTEVSKAPFSFLNNLFWREDIDIESNAGRQILKHELTHIKQRHSYDKLALQLAIILCWLNPFYWLIQKELSLVHEFIADEEAIHDKDTEAFARMLLQTHYGNQFPDVVHPFFHSSVKRRLIMMKQLSKPKYAYLRRLMVLPVLGVAVLLLSFKINARKAVERAKQTIVLALDAGHGGNDKGAKAIDGTYEKDLNLKIARKIAAVAGDYNIRIVPVRMDDNYVTLPDRAAIANNANADVFISVHINSQNVGTPDTGNNKYDLVVDERNAKYVESDWIATNISFFLDQMGKKFKISKRHLEVLKDAKMPAVLIECGYLNNKDNLAALNNDAKLDELSRNILTAIVELKNNPPQPPPPGGTTILITPDKKVSITPDPREK